MKPVYSHWDLQPVQAAMDALRKAGIAMELCGSRRPKAYDDGTTAPIQMSVDPADYARARDVLTAAGLLAPPEPLHPLDTSGLRFAPRPAPTHPLSWARVSGLTFGLLNALGILLGLLLTGVPYHTQVRSAEAESWPTARTRAIYYGSQAATPLSLAEAIFQWKLSRVHDAVQCLEVDGHDAPTVLLDRLQRRLGPATTLVPASQCYEDLRTAAHHLPTGRYAGIYRLRGYWPEPAAALVREPGASLVFLQAGELHLDTIEVQRTGDRWRILRFATSARNDGTVLIGDPERVR